MPGRKHSMPSSDRPPTHTNKQPLDNRNGDSESIFSASFPSIVASRYQKKICTPSCRKNKNTASPFGQRHSAKVYPLLFPKDTEDTRKQPLLLRFGFCDHNWHFFYWLCGRRCSFFRGGSIGVNTAFGASRTGSWCVLIFDVSAEAGVFFGAGAAFPQSSFRSSYIPI